MEIISELPKENLPPWVSEVRTVLEQLEKLSNKQKKERLGDAFNRERLSLIQEQFRHGSLEELQYWESIRDFFHDIGMLDQNPHHIGLEIRGV